MFKKIIMNIIRNRRTLFVSYKSDMNVKTCRGWSQNSLHVRLDKMHQETEVLFLIFSKYQNILHMSGV